MDPAQSTALLTVFGLGSSWGTFTLGPIIRQVTEDLAMALSAFPGLVARPHHLIYDASLDPNLDDLDPDVIDEGRPRIRFILPHALPSDSLVRQLASQQGTPVALTGRLDIHRKDFELALNVWDTSRPNLLYCGWDQGEVDNLLGTLAGRAGAIARAFGVADEELAVNAAARAFGTSSWPAYETYSAATEKLRNLVLGTGGARHTDIPRLLCSALSLDAQFEKPRLLLVEHAMQRLTTADAQYAAALLDGLNKLKSDWVVYGLLRFEAMLVQDNIKAAARLLSDLRLQFPGEKALTAAQRRLPSN